MLRLEHLRLGKGSSSVWEWESESESDSCSNPLMMMTMLGMLVVIFATVSSLLVPGKDLDIYDVKYKL